MVILKYYTRIMRNEQAQVDFKRTEDAEIRVIMLSRQNKMRIDHKNTEIMGN